jgi:hypothetical protein
MYIGTTQVAINRASASLTLTGVSIDGSAGTLNGLPVAGSPAGGAYGSSGTVWPAIPRIAADGVTEIGKFLDFHDDANDAADYSVRLTSSGTSLTCSGTFTATKVYNAVFNDIADFLEIEEPLDEIQYGRCYVRTKDGKTRLSQEPKERGIIGIASDTYGYGLGKKDIGTREIPVAIGGFVLAFCDREYESGDLLTSGPDGVLTGISVEDSRPGITVAMFHKTPASDEWNGIKVNGRYIVKVL